LLGHMIRDNDALPLIARETRRLPVRGLSTRNRLPEHARARRAASKQITRGRERFRHVKMIHDGVGGRRERRWITSWKVPIWRTSSSMC